MILADIPRRRIRAGDQLLVAGEAARVRRLLGLGDVQLVGKQADAAAEKRAQAAGLGRVLGGQRVYVAPEVVGRTDHPPSQIVDRRALLGDRPQLADRHLPAVGQPIAAVLQALRDGDLLAGGLVAGVLLTAATSGGWRW